MPGHAFKGPVVGDPPVVFRDRLHSFSRSARGEALGPFRVFAGHEDSPIHGTEPVLSTVQSLRDAQKRISAFQSHSCTSQSRSLFFENSWLYAPQLVFLPQASCLSKPHMNRFQQCPRIGFYSLRGTGARIQII